MELFHILILVSILVFNPKHTIEYSNFSSSLAAWAVRLLLELPFWLHLREQRHNSEILVQK